jgi:hypothetical protein
MPTLQKLFYLDINITPEKFIGNCSEVELQETILLANIRLNRLEKTPAKPPEQKTIKAFEQAAADWANAHCDINDKTVEATNEEVNLYLKDAFVAGVEFAQQWIPVGKCLPINDNPVLVKIGRGSYDVRSPICDFGAYRFSNSVTYWRPVDLE